MNVFFLFKKIILVQYTFFYSKTAQKGVPIWDPLLYASQTLFVIILKLIRINT